MQCGQRQWSKRLHMNDLKQWYEPPSEDECILAVDPTELPDGGLPWTPQPEEDVLPILDASLSPEQKQDIHRLLQDFPRGFSLWPGTTALVTHGIKIPLGTVVWTLLRPIPRMRWDTINREVEDKFYDSMILCLVWVSSNPLRVNGVAQ